MSRWRLALVVEVDADTEDEAAQAGEDIANSSDHRFVLDSVWIDRGDAQLWGKNLGPMRDM